MIKLSYLVGVILSSVSWIDGSICYVRFRYIGHTYSYASTGFVDTSKSSASCSSLLVIGVIVTHWDVSFLEDAIDSDMWITQCF